MTNWTHCYHFQERGPPELIPRELKISHDINDLNTRERELRSQIKASRALRSENPLVITWDYEAVEEFKGKRITLMPLWKWLLM